MAAASGPQMCDPFHRYHRQMLLAGIGPSGQERLRGSHALLIGCGALGTVIADTLVRSGVGRLTLVDRDVVEITNLQRQILFDEDDVKAVLPKAEAARRRLARINSQVRLDAHVDDFNARNAESFLDDVSIILDGLDNFETRYLLNDLAIKHEIPYIYGGAVGTTGMSMAVLPSGALVKQDPGPCLRCVFPEAPPPGAAATCDTVGVLGPVVMTIAAHQAAQAIKLLTGNADAVDRALLSIDLWTNDVRQFNIASARNPDCACCAQRRFEHLDDRKAGGATTLCGRNAVQIVPSDPDGKPGRVNLRAVVARLSSHGEFTCDDLCMRGTFSQQRADSGDHNIEIVLFSNGRAIIRGTDRPEVARSIYARYIGR